MPEESDTALIEATAKGELAAFERLHGRYHGRLFGFAMRLLGRSDLAEEVVSDALMVVWRRAGDFEGRSRPSTWIFGIVYRTAMKARGRAARDRLHDEIDDQLPAQRTGPEEIEIIFRRRQIAAALARLPAEQRATVELTYYHGYRLTEIAEITGCPVGTVKTRMFHARAKLREMLRGEAPEMGERQ